MTRLVVLVEVALMLVFCSMSFAADTVFLPTAPISDDWIAHIYAKLNEEGIEIMVRYQYSAEGRLLKYEDISLSIVDNTATRAVPIREKGIILFVAMAGQAQAPFVVKVDAKEIRAVNVRVGDLVVSLAPSVTTDSATKSVPHEKAEDKKP
jgi:hypothetical protein